MAFQKEKQNISATQLLQAFAEEDYILLSRCTITDVFDINRLFDQEEKFHTEKLEVHQTDDTKTLVLAQSIVFDRCTFEENVVFSGPWSDPDSLRVEFKTELVFSKVIFKGQARFRGAVFHDTAGFDGCIFDGVTTFRNATFTGDAKFRTAVFSGYSLFGSASFKSAARFTNTHFVKGVDFAATKFSGFADFDGVYASSRAIPKHDSIYFAKKRYGGDESFWRFAKQSATEAGYYQFAGECFYNERCARLWKKIYGPIPTQQLSLAKKIWHNIWSVRLLPELVFGKLLFGYGERPIRVLGASALVILFCAFLYARPDVLLHRAGTNEPSFLQGLYFSTVTFTTLGYGDLYPAANTFSRLIAMTEAAIGGCLMALFVVCLAKRFSRG